MFLLWAASFFLWLLKCPCLVPVLSALPTSPLPHPVLLMLLQCGSWQVPNFLWIRFLILELAAICSKK